MKARKANATNFINIKDVNGFDYFIAHIRTWLGRSEILCLIRKQ